MMGSLKLKSGSLASRMRLSNTLKDTEPNTAPSTVPAAEETVHDVIIVGAGPCGLAVAARLCERTPSALFTDDEHGRYHWIRRHSGRMSVLDRRNRTVREARQSQSQQCSVLVLDASGNEWLSRWKKLFALLRIKHLRSPMFFHVDPRDRDALLAFAHQQGSQHECDEIAGCVGKERSKHLRKKDRKRSGPRPVAVDERDRKDYCTPTSDLFADHCCHVARHYKLEHRGIIKQEEVRSVEYLGHAAEGGHFRVQTDENSHRARVVVLAVGAGNKPTVPGLLPNETLPGLCHAMQIKSFPDPTLGEKMERGVPTNVLVVGGGLTSAQIADIALQSGVTKVWLVMRGHLQVKPFDLNIEWLGKYRNLEHASFWSADSDEERLQQILSARNGGSITPRYHKILKQHIAAGKLGLMTNTSVISRAWDSALECWKVQTEPQIDLPPLDYIYYATGVQTDVERIPMLENLRKKHPIRCLDGLPCINDDLMWKDNLPLFVTGRLAALRLGPGAANLAGARSGAERIAWSISDILDGNDAQLTDSDSYQLGIGNRYLPLTHSNSTDSESESYP